MTKVKWILGILGLMGCIVFLTSCIKPAHPPHARPRPYYHRPAPPPAEEPAPAATGGGTYTNTEKGFSYTIPAGWELVSGDPNTYEVTFMITKDSCSFIANYDPMVKSFPAGASVKASLQQSKEMIEIGKLMAAKRRDQKIKWPDKSKKGFKRVVIGWEIVEAPQKNGFQRIIYQAYDRNNIHYYFNAAASNEKFEYCRPMLRSIIDSIRFE
jgi:hypothetical protein